MNIKKVIKLDFLSIMPYFTIKNLVLLISLSLIYAIMTKTPALVISTTQMFALLFSAYPFMVGEEAGIDPLYRIFNIKPIELVKGRYLVGIIFVLIMLIAGLLLAGIISYFYPIRDIKAILLLLTPSTFIISTMIIFIEYPIYFKFGYAKGKALIGIPFLILAIIILASNFCGDLLKSALNYITAHKAITIACLIGLWAVTAIVSFNLSNKFYSKKDF